MPICAFRGLGALAHRKVLRSMKARTSAFLLLKDQTKLRIGHHRLCSGHRTPAATPQVPDVAVTRRAAVCLAYGRRGPALKTTFRMASLRSGTSATTCEGHCGILESG